MTDNYVGFGQGCLVGAHPDWHQHGVSLFRIFRLRKIVVIWILLFISTFFLFPDSGLYRLKGFDLFFDLFFHGVTLKTSNSIYIGWKLRQFDLHFAPISVCRRSIADAPRTHWNRSPNAGAVQTGVYVAGRSAGYENQALSSLNVIPLKLFYYQTFFETWRN